MTGYTKLDRTSVLEETESKSTPAKVAKVAKEGSGAACTLCVSDSSSLLTFAKVANPGGAAPMEHLPAPLTAGFPCVVCDGRERWNDAGVWRCLACWPSPLTQQALTAERVYQRAGRRR
jgi:hypothetical protein